MMGLAQMLRVLRGRAGLFTTIVLVVVTGVAVISLLSPKKYVAELAMVVDLQGSDPMKEQALAPPFGPMIDRAASRWRSGAGPVKSTVAIALQPAMAG